MAISSSRSARSILSILIIITIFTILLGCLSLWLVNLLTASRLRHRVFLTRLTKCREVVLVQFCALVLVRWHLTCLLLAHPLLVLGPTRILSLVATLLDWLVLLVPGLLLMVPLLITIVTSLLILIVLVLVALAWMTL